MKRHGITCFHRNVENFFSCLLIYKTKLLLIIHLRTFFLSYKVRFKFILFFDLANQRVFDIAQMFLLPK